MKILRIIVLLVLYCIGQAQELKTVDYVDLKRYLGRWYEQARLATQGEKGCKCSEAFYSERSEISINIENECLKNGKKSTVSGYAYPIDDTNSKLIVKFPFTSGDYWIIDLDQNYQWAVVSGPTKSNFFILSRNQDFDEDIRNMLVDNARKLGFPVEDLVFRDYFCGYC